jgi:hypothetical protein
MKKGCEGGGILDVGKQTTDDRHPIHSLQSISIF